MLASDLLLDNVSSSAAHKVFVMEQICPFASLPHFKKWTPNEDIVHIKQSSIFFLEARAYSSNNSQSYKEYRWCSKNRCLDLDLQSKEKKLPKKQKQNSGGGDFQDLLHLCAANLKGKINQTHCGWSVAKRNPLELLIPSVVNHLGQSPKIKRLTETRPTQRSTTTPHKHCAVNNCTDI